MTFAEAALLGFVQGVAEWLPVSSEGVVAAIQTLAFGADAADAVAFSLWLHLGTALAALAALRKDAAEIVRSAIRAPTRPTRAAAFLAVATLTSAPLGLALLAGLDGFFSERLGGLAMALVGALMMITGAILLRGRRGGGARTREDVGALDAVLVGAAQGLAALPGLSRSGLTVSALLWRGLDRREALALSFLLSVPASVGAGAVRGAGFGASDVAAGAAGARGIGGGRIRRRPRADGIGAKNQLWLVRARGGRGNRGGRDVDVGVGVILGRRPASGRASAARPRIVPAVIRAHNPQMR